MNISRNILYLAVFIAVTFLNLPLYSQINCVSVDDNGDVIVSWQASTDADFASYEIFFSNSADGPFNSLVTFTDITKLNFVHNGAMADFSVKYYYLRVNKLSDFVDFDVFSSILLNLNNPGNGNATLTWSEQQGSINPTYIIERKDEFGTFSIIDSTHNLNYTDTIALCAAQLWYRIKVESENCVSYSAPKEDFFRDLVPPAIPILDSISILPENSKLTLGWEPSVSTDTEAYLLYKFENGIWSILDTVWGIDNTIYQYDESEVENQSLSYRIAALDSCGNASPLGDIHNSLFLTFNVNTCQRGVSLQWNEYENIPSGNLSYLIFSKKDNDDFELISEVSSLQTGYYMENLEDFSNYEIYISVKSNSGITASSQIIEFQYIPWEKPEDILIRYVDVNEDQNIDIGVFVDNSVPFQSITLMKKGENGAYADISTKTYTGSDFYEFFDDNVNTDLFSYTYKVAITDICSHRSLISDSVSSILLDGESQDGFKMLLEWSPYIGFAGGVSSYDIYRATELESFFIFANSTSFVEQFYIDDVFPFKNSGAKFRYYIEATQGNNSYGFSDRSRSNVIELSQISESFIPNAFTPEKINPIFKPINIFVDLNSYEFLIFSRDGNLIFSTNNPNEGWDGTFKGSRMKTDTYVYKVSYLKTDGSYFEKTGSVNLIR